MYFDLLREIRNRKHANGKKESHASGPTGKGRRKKKCTIL